MPRPVSSSNLLVSGKAAESWPPTLTTTLRSPSARSVTVLPALSLTTTWTALTWPTYVGSTAQPRATLYGPKSLRTWAWTVPTTAMVSTAAKATAMRKRRSRTGDTVTLQKADGRAARPDLDGPQNSLGRTIATRDPSPTGVGP